MQGIAFQCPVSTIGDVFFTCHLAYGNHVEKNTKVYLYTPTDLRGDLKNIIDRTDFFERVNSGEGNLHEDLFVKDCIQRDLDPHLFTRTAQHYNIKHYPLQKWFNTSGLDKTVRLDNYIILHITSSNNYNRPKIDNLITHLNYIKESGNTPVIIGTHADEELTLKHYPFIKEYFNDETWRFGKDTLEQSMGNILNAKGILSFSSWSSVFAALAGVPTLELWFWDQWLHFNTLAKTMLGNPIHLLQVSYKEPFLHNYYKNSFPYVKMWGSLYHG